MGPPAGRAQPRPVRHPRLCEPAGALCRGPRCAAGMPCPPKLATRAPRVAHSRPAPASPPPLGPLSAVKQEVDRNEDMLRSCLRAVDALAKLPNAQQVG